MAMQPNAQIWKDSDGRIAVNALPYAYEAWEMLKIIALSDGDGSTRVRAAETMIRLAHEFAPKGQALFAFMSRPEDEP